MPNDATNPPFSHDVFQNQSADVRTELKEPCCMEYLRNLSQDVQKWQLQLPQMPVSDKITAFQQSTAAHIFPSSKSKAELFAPINSTFLAGCANY